MLIKYLSLDKKSEWAIDILYYICIKRVDLSDIVKESAAKAKGMLRLILLYCNCVADENSFWNEMDRLILEGVAKSDRKFLPFFGQIEINWTNRTDMLIRVLKKRDKGLAHAVLSTFKTFPDGHYLQDNQRWQIELEPLEWWIDFLNDEEVSDVFIDGSDFRSSLGLFIALHAAPATRQQLIAKFNQSGYPYRRILADYILKAIPGMTTDLLSSDGIDFLISELKRLDYNIETYAEAPLLAYIATEEFVEKHLLPLLEYEEEPLKTNLRTVLRRAGERHHRRYVFDL